jgi:hypothetical protein
MRTLIVAISATVLGAAVLATTVFANTTTPPAQATASGQSRAKAFDRLSDVLTGLVQKGVITQQQMAAILDAVKNAAHRDVDARRLVGDVAKASSQYLGISVADLRAELMKGKSLGEIANATPGKSREDLLDTLDKGADARIKAAVDAGKITQAQADELRPKVRATIVKIIDHKRATPVTNK